MKGKKCLNFNNKSNDEYRTLAMHTRKYSLLSAFCLIEDTFVFKLEVLLRNQFARKISLLITYHLADSCENNTSSGKTFMCLYM